MQVKAFVLSVDIPDNGTGTSIMDKTLPEGIQEFVGNGGKIVESDEDSD